LGQATTPKRESSVHYESHNTAAALNNSNLPQFPQLKEIRILEEDYTGYSPDFNKKLLFP